MESLAVQFAGWKPEHDVLSFSLGHRHILPDPCGPLIVMWIVTGILLFIFIRWRIDDLRLLEYVTAIRHRLPLEQALFAQGVHDGGPELELTLVTVCDAPVTELILVFY